MSPGSTRADFAARLKAVPFFARLAPDELAALAREADWREYAPGDLIVREGEIDDRFYILVSGECTVDRHGEQVGTIEAGECFGEAGYVKGARRTATIRAASSVQALKVSATLLEQVSASCQLRFNRMFLKSLITRLQAAEAPVAAAG